jgi:hypothetical protein
MVIGMSFFRKAREVTGDVAAASKRQAQRGKLELEVRRLESKVNSEKDAIGQALFPLLEAGTLQVDLPEVHDRMKTIGELLGEVGQRKAEIETLGHAGGDAPAEP